MENRIIWSFLYLVASASIYLCIKLFDDCMKSDLLWWIIQIGFMGIIMLIWWIVEIIIRKRKNIIL